MTSKEKQFEKQILKLPKQVEFCNSCVMSNQRPRIVFDENGVCSACNNTINYKSRIDWSDRERELIELLDKHRSSDGRYDVIVPSSGGKDSVFVAHELKHKYGMNPLTVTWPPLMYTDIGYSNFIKLRDAGFANITLSPNGALHRQLARLCFEELGDAFHVFVLGQVNMPFRIAAQMGIKLVMFGENGEADYAGNPESVEKALIPFDFFRDFYEKGSSVKNLIDYGRSSKDYFTAQFSTADLELYQLPDPDVLLQSGIEGKHFYGHYRKWTPQGNYYYAKDATGFSANEDRTEGTYSRYASLDDRADGFHYYMKFIKFGFGRCTDDASHEIRDGVIDREDGVSLVHKYDGEFPKKYQQDFLDFLGIDDEIFQGIVDSFRLDHIWEKRFGKWELKKRVE